MTDRSLLSPQSCGSNVSEEIFAADGNTSSEYSVSCTPIAPADNAGDAIEKRFILSPKLTFEEGSYKLFQELTTQKTQSVYNSAIEAYSNKSYKSCLSYLSKAFFMDPDNVNYYILSGDAYLGLKDFKSATLNYKRVCILRPEKEEYFTKLADIYHQQGEWNFNEKSYVDALECFTRASEMKPDITEYHNRSIDCLAALNRHKECLGFINKRLVVEPTNTNLLLFRAKLHLLFCSSTLSYFDVKEALTIDPENPEANEMFEKLQTKAESHKERAEQLDLVGKSKEAILKISQAIATNPSVIEYHVLRASMHRRNNDFNASVDDLLLSMDKVNHNPESPLFKDAQIQLLLTFNDFAVQCFQKGFYEEAIVLIEKAIKGEKHNKALYSNRGDCFLKLGHLHFSLLDYQQAQELDPSDKSISLRLAVVYNELGILEYKDRKYYKAESYFSLAISHDPTVSAYHASRGRSRYMGENLVEAQVDIISALYLDKENKEVLSMFSRLFPSKSIEEVLNGEFGHMVIEALKSVLDEKHTDNQKKDSLNKASPLPDIDTRSSINAQMKQCMEDQQFHFSIIKGKKMVNNLVEAVIQSKQDLAFDGPSVPSQTDILAKASQLKTIDDVIKHAEAFETAIRDQSQLHNSSDAQAARVSDYRRNKNKGYQKQQKDSCSGCGSTSHGTIGRAGIFLLFLITLY